ncbi:hypothetical protein D9M71_789590 [compost metagenome]
MIADLLGSFPRVKRLSEVVVKQQQMRRVLLGQVLQGFCGPTTGSDLCTLFQQLFGQRKPEAAARAGNPGSFGISVVQKPIPHTAAWTNS